MWGGAGVAQAPDWRCMSFREIAQRKGISLTRVRRSLNDAPPSRTRREIRAEIAKAGGLSCPLLYQNPLRWPRASGGQR
jgi:hypothetical protein